MVTPIEVVVFKCCKSCPMGNHVLFTSLQKKTSAASQTVATARIAPKICQGQPPTFGSHCSRFHPNQFTLGRVIAECVNAFLLPHIVCPRFARSEASLPANNQRSVICYISYYICVPPKLNETDNMKICDKLT